MSGGLTQLVAYGAQDVFLTGEPQVSFFRKEYKRHSNFSVESIEQTFQGTVDFGKKVTVTVSRNADLIHKTYLQVTIPDVDLTFTGTAGVDDWKFQWLPEVGHFLIKSVEVEVGGQRIDKHYGTWLSIWSSLTLESGKSTGYSTMIGGSLAGAVSTNPADVTVENVTAPGDVLYVPLQFWFCRHTGLALPLIALMYHEVKFNIEFEEFAKLYTTTQTVGGLPTVTKPTLGSTSLWVDYVYLDRDERTLMAQQPHEYLIEQLQSLEESLTGASPRVRLSFNHPCKELVWVVQGDSSTDSNFTDAALSAGTNPITEATLLLNGSERFKPRAGTYFNKVQPYQHHTNIPAEGINVYSFALHPEEFQPSGSLNMSRIDNAVLQLKLTAASAADSPVLKLYAVNYNVFRIRSGMGGLAYSN